MKEIDKRISSILNEENCKEIVHKLIKNNYINEIVYSIDGKDLVTNEQLDKEIMEELHSLNDRVSLLDLQSSLSIDQPIIEKRINLLIKEGNNKLYFKNSELFGKIFIKNILQQVNEQLDQFGIVLLTDISKEYSLSFEFISELINDHREHFNEACIDSDDKGTIYTKRYVERQKRLIQGLLLAITRPTPLSSLSSHSTINPKFFNSLLEELIVNKKVSGFLKKKKSKGEINSPYFKNQEGVYVPNIYIRAQEAWIKMYYEQHGCIDFEAIKKLEVCESKEFLSLKFPDAILLQSNAIKKSMLMELDKKLEVSLKDNKFINIMDVLPSNFTVSDAIILLQCLPYFQVNSPILAPPHRILSDSLNCPIILSDVYVTTTTQFLHDFVEDMLPYLKKRAYTFARNSYIYDQANKYTIYKNNLRPNKEYESKQDIGIMESGDSYGLVTLDELSFKVMELLRSKLDDFKFVDSHLCTIISSIIYRQINNHYRSMLQMITQKFNNDTSNVVALKEKIKEDYELLHIFKDAMTKIDSNLVQRSEHYLISKNGFNLVKNISTFLTLSMNPIQGTLTCENGQDYWNIEDKIIISNQKGGLEEDEGINNLICDLNRKVLSDETKIESFLQDLKKLDIDSFFLITPTELDKIEVISNIKEQLVNSKSTDLNKMIRILMIKHMNIYVEFPKNECKKFLKLLKPFLDQKDYDFLENFDPSVDVSLVDHSDSNSFKIDTTVDNLGFTV